MTDLHLQPLQLRSEADTDRLGALLGQFVPDGTVVGLIGTLGAGKTRLVRGVAGGLGVDPESVQSPTFVLCHEYSGRRPITHFDAYRLNNVDEFLDLGAEEYWGGPGLVFIEWSDRVQQVLPPERIDVRMEVTDEDHRQVTLESSQEDLRAVCRHIAELFQQP